MLTVEEMGQALTYANNGATFMFIPSSSLCNKVTLDSPEAQDIGKTMKVVLLERKPIRVETEMIVRYCKGSLDNKNSWLLDQGDIKVIPSQFETKIKENDNE